MNSQMKGYIGRGLGGSGVQELLSPWSRGGFLSSWCGCVHPLEALQTPNYWGITETYSHRHDQSLTPFPAPLPCLEDEGWE